MSPLPLTLGIVTPCPRRSCKGNRITAVRWAGLLRRLGHKVFLEEAWTGRPCDALLALHAFKSAASVERFRGRFPGRPVALLLTGTDLYDGLEANPTALAALAAADRCIVLQPHALADLPAELRVKSRVVRQSATPPRRRDPPATDAFEIAVVAHLRDVKDPFRAALAMRLLPASSRLRVVHVGECLSEGLREAALREAAENPRWLWLGKLGHSRAVAVLARTRALLLTSRSEGGANVVSEALAAGVPVLSSRIAGSIGILGEAYPGYFEVGDERGLAALLTRFENDLRFRSAIERWCRQLAPLAEPVREQDALAGLLDEFFPGRGRPHAPPTPRLVSLGTGEEPPFVRLTEDVRRGLTASPKSLSCRFFYDAEGSRLFDEICALPEYYVWRAEDGLLRARADDMVAAIPAGVTLVELGSGSATKTRRILDALLKRHRTLRYAMIDISPAALAASAKELLASYPTLEVVAIAAEYEEGLARLEEFAPSPRLLLWLGSNVGNFHRADAAAFLGRIRARLAPVDRLLVGIDLRKAKHLLERAYDDSAGVTARFNRNLLVRINAELGGHFDPEAFRHEATYDVEQGRVEMWLVSEREQRVAIDLLDLEVRFAAGERIHTEDSYKYSPAEIEALAAAAGLRVEQEWFDAEHRFCDSLLAPRERGSLTVRHPSLAVPTGAELVVMLRDARARTLKLVGDLTEAQMRVPRLAILNPPLWEIGHVAWFAESWCLRHAAGRPPRRADGDALFDSAAVAHDTRWDLALPPQEAVLAWLQSVLEDIAERLVARPPSADDLYFAQLALFHEDMHGEALAYTRQTLGLARPAIEGPPIDDKVARAGPLPGDVEVAGGTLRMGAEHGTTFVFDNEKWAHPVVVAPFRIARAAVTQAQFAEFVEAGGYRRRELWSEKGWEWRSEQKAEHPLYWRREPDGTWMRRSFDRWKKLEEHCPVLHVNWWEAEAFCRWAERRLPTEAEWELAASGAPGPKRSLLKKRLFPWGDAEPTSAHAHLGAHALDPVDVAAHPEGESAWGCRQLLGNVWEWTASDFVAYPGFAPDPYKEYSEPWFGWHKVLRGGCLVTQPRLLRNTWRNFYTPDRRDVWAGFRTAAR